jgi:DNA-binding NtrC family response regulator
MPLTGHRILLVEDELLIALDVKRTLQAAHGEVVGRASNVAKAMKLADTPSLSSAVLDFRLQFRNSFAVAAKLHAAGVPFIFYTANSISELSAAWPGVPTETGKCAPGADLTFAGQRNPPRLVANFGPVGM